MENLCGIDEAGRGPIAGPMTVAGVILKSNIKGLMDSKKLTPKKREALFNVIKENSYYHIVFVDQLTIDEKGLSLCIKESVLTIMKKIEATTYLIDGNTTFSIPFLQCKIKADETVQEVSAASILAKVSRDRYMTNICASYPVYNFSKHKGYGTKEHIEAIKKYGYSPLHRFSFKIKNLNTI